MDRDTLAAASEHILKTLTAYGIQVERAADLSLDVNFDGWKRVFLRLNGAVEFLADNKPTECDRLREYVLDALGDFQLRGEGPNRRLVMVEPLPQLMPA